MLFQTYFFQHLHFLHFFGDFCRFKFFLCIVLLYVNHFLCKFTILYPNIIYINLYMSLSILLCFILNRVKKNRKYLCFCRKNHFGRFTNFRVSKGFPYWSHRCFYWCTIMYNFFKIKKTQKIKNRFLYKKIQNDIKYRN